MWVLDSLAEVGKLSPIQVIILIEYDKTEEPRPITDIINVLSDYFEGLWEPKKGTIYPSVHNLAVRGFLKLHGTRPYGYSITDKGKDAVKSIKKNLRTQFEVELKYFQFIIDLKSSRDKSNAEKIIESINDFISNFEERIEKE